MNAIWERQGFGLTPRCSDCGEPLQRKAQVSAAEVGIGDDTETTYLDEFNCASCNVIWMEVTVSEQPTLVERLKGLAKERGDLLDAQ